MASFEYNTEIFYVRTDINEFLREHPLVSDLYDVVLQWLLISDKAKDAALDIFNEAYYVCTLVTEKGAKKDEIEKLILSDRSDPELGILVHYYESLVAMVAKCLLRVHQELLVFDSDVIKTLAKISEVTIDPKMFDIVLRNYLGDFDKPLDFSGKLIAMPYWVNKCKDERIAELENMLQLEREKNLTLSMRISSMVYYKVSQEVDTAPICSEDEIYNAINYQTIAEYACGRTEAQANFISNMILRLAMRGRLSDESSSKIDAAIEEIENAHKPQTSREIRCEKYVEMEINNDNKDSQVFNGGITNSKFGK